MRFSTPLILGLAATPAWSQYSRPNIISPSPAITFQDNIVTPYAEMPVSPLDTIVKGLFTPEYTGVVNVRRGRLELYYEFTTPTGAVEQHYISETPIPVGATSYVRRPGTNEWWVLCPNSRGAIDPATGLPHDGGVVVVIDGLTGSPVNTIAVGKGPSGIAFHPSQNVAWVTCRFSKDLLVIDTQAGVVVKTIELRQFTPHAIDFLPATNEVLVASHLSGNNTSARGENPGDVIPTVIEYLPRDPQAANSLPDRDVVVLSVDPANALNTNLDSADSRLASDVMTIQYNLTVDPNAARAFVVGTEGLNAQFVGEKNAVGGGVVENRLAIIDYSAAGPPTITRVSLDGTAIGSIGTPTDFVFSPGSPSRGWLVARGSDRVVEFNISVSPPVPVGFWQVKSGAPGYEATMVGARLAKLDSSGTRLTVWCEIENSFAVIDVTNPPLLNAKVDTVALTYDPLPAAVKRGWSHVSDTRRSANGSTSCNSCHVDGGSDNLLWDLSKWHDAEGTAGTQLKHEQDNKGPMLTQVLFGLPETGPYHWRGEQVDLGEFNGTFPDLMETPALDNDEKKDMEAYLGFLRHAPNPNLALDRSYANTPSPQGVGNVADGLADFREDNYANGSNLKCATCHSLPTGTNNQIQNLSGMVGPPSSAVQVAQLRGVGNRLDEPFMIGGTYGERSRNGAGLIHSAAEGSFEDFLSSPVFNLVAGNQSRIDDLTAFLESFDTGMAPSTGFVEVLRPGAPSLVADLNRVMNFVQTQAEAGHADFTALVTLKDPLSSNYIPYPMFYDTSRLAFVLATASGPNIYQSTLLDFLTDPRAPRPITILGHPPGSGQRWSIDADNDQLLDIDEAFTPGLDLFNADTDGDGRPDGYEMVTLTDPTVVDGILDTTDPIMTHIGALFVTTNTVKLEIHTDEPCKVRAYMMIQDASQTLVEYPLIGASEFGEGGFSTQNQIVAGGLPSVTEIFLMPFQVEFGAYLFFVEAMDPSGNVQTRSFPVLTLARSHAVRVESISDPTFRPGSGATLPTAGFNVNLALGTAGTVDFGGEQVLPSYPLPSGSSWDVRVRVSYGLKLPGSGTEVTNLVFLPGPNADGTWSATQAAGLGPAAFQVDLPPGTLSSQPNKAITVTVDDVRLIVGPSSYDYVETQAYKRHYTVLQLP